MSDESTKVPTVRVGKFDDALEAQIDLRPTNPEARRLVEDAVKLAMMFPSPSFADIVKAVGTVGGWLWQPRKGERVQDFLLGLYQRLERTRSEYLKKEEAQELFEDVIRRVSEQPDAVRRTKLEAIFGRVLRDPREHVENRLLLRLADELPSQALALLGVLDRKLVPWEVENRVATYILAARLGLSSPDDVTGPMTYLVNENVRDEEAFLVTPGFGAAGDDLMFLLTPLGRTFVEYIRT